MGASSSNVAFTGKGELGDVDFTFSGPIDSIKMKYALGEKFNHEHDYNSLVFQEDSFVLTVDSDKMKVEGAELSGEVKKAIADQMTKKLIEMKVAIQDAEQELIDQFPTDLAVPFVFLFYATQFAQSVTLNSEFVEMQFSLEHLGLLGEEQKKLLKPIESAFYKDTNEDGDKFAAQIIIDDNLFNSFSSAITTIEKMFSVRDLMMLYPNAKPFIGMMNTDTISKVLPDFADAGKAIDIVLSPSHDLFLDGVPGSKMTGIYMDKNGNWKVQVNIPA